jgi:multidrug transporter EmrE-like cation transporter
MSGFMSPLAFGLILTGVLLNALAQLLLKAGVNRLGVLEFSLHKAWPLLLALAGQWPIVLGLACYAVSVVVWILALSRTDVTIAYPMLSIGYVVNALGAYWWLGESLSFQRLGAIAIILVGVVLLARS